MVQQGARVALTHRILVRVQVSDPKFEESRTVGAVRQSRSVVSREVVGSNPIRSARAWVTGSVEGDPRNAQGTSPNSIWLRRSGCNQQITGIIGLRPSLEIAHSATRHGTAARHKACRVSELSVLGVNGSMKAFQA